MKKNLIQKLIKNIAHENIIVITDVPDENIIVNTDDVCKLVTENIEKEIVEKLSKAIGITNEEFEEFVKKNIMKE